MAFPETMKPPAFSTEGSSEEYGSPRVRGPMDEWLAVGQGVPDQRYVSQIMDSAPCGSLRNSSRNLGF
jgi:hypothetical protein